MDQERRRRQATTQPDVSKRKVTTSWATIIAAIIALGGTIITAAATITAPLLEPKNMPATPTSRPAGANASLSSKPESSPTESLRPSTATPTGATHTITYKVGGTAERVDIEYTTPTWSEEVDNVKPPWQKSFKIGDDASGAPLGVYVNNYGGGTITCEYDVDGKKVNAESNQEDGYCSAGETWDEDKYSR